MKALALLLPLCLVAAADPSGSVPAHALVLTVPVDAYADLLAQYEEADAEFQDMLAEASSIDERRKLQKKNPVVKHWRKFDKLSKSDVRATLWMIGHADQKESDPGKLKKLQDGLVKKLLRSDVGSPAFGDVLRALKDASSVDEETHEELLDKVLADSPHVDVRAQALYRKAWLFKRSKDKAKRNQHEPLLAQCAQEYGGTRYGTLALAATVKAEDLAVGKDAPNFYAETIEGHGFSLSDYKGKVVLLDFYGFW